jgi:hypothetical protein
MIRRSFLKSILVSACALIGIKSAVAVTADVPEGRTLWLAVTFELDGKMIGTSIIQDCVLKIFSWDRRIVIQSPKDRNSLYAVSSEVFSALTNKTQCSAYMSVYAIHKKSVEKIADYCGANAVLSGTWVSALTMGSLSI